MVLPANQVVFIPGFGGSALNYQGGYGGVTNYWYNPAIMARNNPLSAALATDGESPYPTYGKTLYPAGPVQTNVYSAMLTALLNAGWNPAFWAYDWRLDAQTLANQLVAFLSSANVSNPFSVVCHSYGGLIAQLAYPAYKSSSAKNVWAQSVYLGVPCGGSYWPAAALAGWFPGYSELSLLGRAFNIANPALVNLAAPVYSALLVALGQLVGSWPALYCLLPNAGGPWAAIDANASALQNPAAYSNSWGGQIPRWFTLGANIMATLVTNLAGSRPTETSFVGTGTSTLASYKGLAFDPSEDGSYINGDGDGTVPTNRATPGSLGQTVQFPGVSHTGLCQDSGPVNALLELLSGGLKGSMIVEPTPLATIPGPAEHPARLNATIPFPFSNVHGDP